MSNEIVSEIKMCEPSFPIFSRGHIFLSSILTDVSLPFVPVYVYRKKNNSVYSIVFNYFAILVRLFCSISATDL